MRPPPTITRALADAGARLSPASPTARLDAEVLLAHACSLARSALLAHGARVLSDAEGERFAGLVDRRGAGEPVAYLTGRREFWSLDLEVGPAVLIPRPETELLVEQALARVPHGAAWSIADLGVGSGAVALAIGVERPRCRVVATERDPAALAVAARNRDRLGIGNVELRAGDWCDPLDGERFDIIVSNPPYVADSDPHLGQGDVRFEPRAALAAGADGLDAIRRLVACAPAHLRPGGWLLLEHGFDQAQRVRGLMARAGLGAVATHVDLSGTERVTEGRAA
jgi:release factor glutamine methyltransferase